MTRPTAQVGIHLHSGRVSPPGIPTPLGSHHSARPQAKRRHGLGVEELPPEREKQEKERKEKEEKEKKEKDMEKEKGERGERKC